MTRRSRGDDDGQAWFEAKLATAAVQIGEPPVPAPMGLEWADDGVWLGRVRKFHMATDRVAIDARRVVERVELVLAYVALAGVVVAELSTTLIRGNFWLAGLGTALGFLGTLAVGLRWRRAHHDLWLRARYAAEISRVAQYAAMVGKDVVAEERAVVSSMPADQDPTRWLRSRIRSVLIGRPSVTIPDPRALARGVSRHWIEEQAEYHERTSERLQKRVALARWVAFGAFALATVLSARPILLAAFGADLNSTLNDWFELLDVTAPALASTVMLRVAQRESARLAARSALMARRFALIRERLVRVADREQVVTILAGAVSDSMHEVYEWSVLLGSFETSAAISSQSMTELDPTQLEILAQAFHDGYRRDQAGRKSADDPAMQPWQDLDDSLRESNRALAADVSVKLQLIGAWIVAHPTPNFEFTADEIERLATCEHERWNAERIAAGWTLGDRDVANKKTPYLVPYADLPEDVRGYDRDAVRNIPRVLHSIGLGIERAPLSI
ncbi:MAG: RyR domain-containing protein [Planctomycetota bacterium]